MLPLSIGATLVLMHYYDRSTHFSKTELPIFYSLLFTWSRNMIQLQLCFVTKQVYQPFNIGTLFFIGMVFFGCMCK